MNANHIDCVVIGYNELPFENYESFLKDFGEDSVAYHNLKSSFVNIDGKKLDYTSLINFSLHRAQSAPAGGDSFREFRSGDIPNLAAVYLTNFLRRRGLSAKYINLFQYEKDKLRKYLADDPLCVAITTTFYSVNLPVNEVIKFIKAHNRRTKIVVGGPLIANHARNYKNETLKIALDDMGADIYVIEGAGELALSSIVDCLKNGGKLGDIPNIAYYEDGKFYRTASSIENNSMDDNAINWLDFAEENLGRTIQTRTARSCAFKCSFCNYPTRAGGLTLASVETVERELRYMHELGEVKNVVFIDDTFNVPLTRFKDLCRMMIKNNFKFNWFSYFRCSNSDDEAFDLMAESGCKGVFLGIESGSPAILKIMNKAATPERYAYGIKRLKDLGILTFGSFIIGFPGETWQTVDETLNFIKDNQPTYYRATSWYCEPGTPIDQQREKYGIRGSGFDWSHNTMNSLETMDHINRIILSVDKSQWLPQWSFDFWFIPYLIGRGVTTDQFKEFVTLANRLLAMEIAGAPDAQKKGMQEQVLGSMVDSVKNWKFV